MAIFARKKTKKIIGHSIQNETQTRKTKLVNLNTTQDPPRNRPLARLYKKERAFQHAAARGPPAHARDT